MKKAVLVSVLIVMIMAVVGLVGGNGVSFGATSGDTPPPTLTVWPPVVANAETTKMVLMGSGFKPGEELYLMMADGWGTITDISESLTPAPAEGRGIVADSSGTFAHLFTLGRLARIQAEGVVNITVYDSSDKIVTVASLGLADPNGVSTIGLYPKGKPDYVKNPKDPRPLPWLAPFFQYPKRP